MSGRNPSSNYLFSWVVALTWLLVAATRGLWHLFSEFWPVSLTMAFGSFIAGATAEGGGAVAFPVFTKALHIPAKTARDFALAIQSVGMTCGSLLICRSGYGFLPEAFGWSFLGGIPGLILGIEFVAPLFGGTAPKVFFTLFTVSFGVCLYMINRGFRSPAAALSVTSFKRRIAFILTGLVGGTVAGVIGSGADVVLFTVLCLRYGVDEKIGTRTTIFLMASLSMVGFGYLGLSGQLSPQVLPMWFCTVPIVAFGAPLGAIFCNRQKRENVVTFLLCLIAFEAFSTFLLIPLDREAIFWSVTFLGVSLSSLWLMGRGKPSPDCPTQT